jgi:hypothetical protein
MKKSVSMPEVRRNLLRKAAAGCRQHSRHRYPALYERFRSVLYLHDYVRPNTKHRGVSTPVVPRRRARIDYVGSAAAVAHGHAIHQLEHHGQLRMMPGARRIAGRRGSVLLSLGKRCPGHRRRTHARSSFHNVVSSWFSFVFTCMHTHESHTSGTPRGECTQVRIGFHKVRLDQGGPTIKSKGFT